VMIDDVNVTDKTEVTSQFATGQFTIELSVDMTPLGFVAVPAELVFAVNNRDPLPSTNLTIRPVGDVRAPWTLEPDMGWLDFEQMSGEGEMTFLVSVNTRMLDAGQHTGTIRVSQRNYPVYLDIPVRLSMTVGTGSPPQPTDIDLGQNYPNPFNSAAAIVFTLPRGMHATVLVFDALGRNVRAFEGDYAAGQNVLHFDATDLPAGVYEYRLVAGGVVLTKRMLLLR
jgi:hypothetical protein